jgi:predicted DNA-binding WGR domain protein
MKKARLVFKDGSSHKFYEMEEISGNQFVATYGKVGTAGTKYTYHIDDWDKKYNEKLGKGYRVEWANNESMSSLDSIFGELDAGLEKLEEKMLFTILYDED